MAGPPESAQRLAAGGGYQPRTHPIRLAQRAEVLGQPQPGRLAYVGGISPAQAMTACHRPDEIREAVDQLFPRLLIATSSTPDQPSRLKVTHD
jgi:hypothetical protein